MEVRGQFNKKLVLYRVWIPIIKMRPSQDSLNFTMGIPILVKWHFYIESTPWPTCWNHNLKTAHILTNILYLDKSWGGYHHYDIYGKIYYCTVLGFCMCKIIVTWIYCEWWHVSASLQWVHSGKVTQNGRGALWMAGVQWSMAKLQ